MQKGKSDSEQGCGAGVESIIQQPPKPATNSPRDCITNCATDQKQVTNCSRNCITTFVTNNVLSSLSYVYMITNSFE